MRSVGGLTASHCRIYVPRDRDTEFTSRLHLGEILKGRVVASLGPQKAIVKFEGVEALAETRSHLSPGSDIVVRVARLSPKVLLNLVHADPCFSDKPISLIRTYLPTRIPLGETIEKLQEILSDKRLMKYLSVDRTLYQNLGTILSNIIFDETKMYKPEFLLNFMTQSGLLYESKLKRLLLRGVPQLFIDGELNNDLKGLLLKVSQDLNLKEGLGHAAGNGEGGPEEKITHFLKTVRELVDNVELNQLTNCIAKKERNYLYLQIPLAFQDRIDDAELYIYYNHQGKNTDLEKENFNLVFLLNMEELGNVKIDTSIRKRYVYCRIAVEDQTVARFINEFLPVLRNRLSALDYYVEKIDCVVLEDPSEVTVSFGENFASGAVKLVDVKV